MIDNEDEYFKDKKTGWVKPENNPGKLQPLLKKLSLALKQIVEQDRAKLLETTERLKNVLEKSRSINPNIK